MEDSKFCTGCGKTLEPGMQFCPQCGMVVSGSAADEEFKEKQKEFIAILSESRRIWLMFFLAIYAVPVLIISIATLVDASAIANSIWSSTEFQEWISSHGYHITQADVQNYVTYAGSMALASGICALISLICLKVKKYWLVAVATCAAASVLCFWSIFGFIIGILVTWIIITSKELFEETPAATE